MHTVFREGRFHTGLHFSVSKERNPNLLLIAQQNPFRPSKHMRTTGVSRERPIPCKKGETDRS